MSRIMSEEASLYFTAEAALAEQREEMRFGGVRDAAALQAYLRRAFGAVESEAGGPAAHLERRDFDTRVRAMLEPIAARRA